MSYVGVTGASSGIGYETAKAFSFFRRLCDVSWMYAL